jgi:hypothetical protein
MVNHPSRVIPPQRSPFTRTDPPLDLRPTLAVNDWLGVRVFAYPQNPSHPSHQTYAFALASVNLWRFTLLVEGNTRHSLDLSSVVNLKSVVFQYRMPSLDVNSITVVHILFAHLDIFGLDYYTHRCTLLM